MMTAADPFKVFIGYDSREDAAYQVARHSLMTRATIALDVRPIVQNEMRAAGLYWRPKDPLASTEFTYTRFLTPYLAGYAGMAVFCDCDFLWLADIAELVRLATPDKAVWCVQHDYVPKDTVKMDGAVQTQYPRKNWSSLMIFNCSHESVRKLTPDVVNDASPQFLHRMQWADDDQIGALPMEWNWLEGWNEKPAVGTPKAVHFTRGGPWFEGWMDVEYADVWQSELRSAEGAGQRS